MSAKNETNNEKPLSIISLSMSWLNVDSFTFYFFGKNDGNQSEVSLTLATLQDQNVVKK